MDIRYAAGLVDGEGCFGFTKIRHAYVARISVTNTYLSVLSELKAAYGGCIYFATKHVGWKRAGHWQISNSSAEELADRLYPYLRIKQDQAWLLMAFGETRPGRGRASHRSRQLRSRKVLSVAARNAASDAVHPMPHGNAAR